MMGFLTGEKNMPVSCSQCKRFSLPFKVFDCFWWQY